MVIKPKVREYICTTAHPIGCKENIRSQIETIKHNRSVEGTKKWNEEANTKRFKNVLIIGASTGYGLSTRIAAAYGYGSATLGVMYEKPPIEQRTATAGWYNTEAFEAFAASDGLYAKSINGDAFSNEIKEETIDRIKNDLGKVDLVIYSLASARRNMEDGTVYRSTLKTIGEEYNNKTLNLKNNTVSNANVKPATQEELEATIKVMGGEDWRNWIDALSEAGVLAENSVTIAYSYIGPKLTYPIYNKGTIGNAKQHLHDTSVELNKLYAERGLKAYVSVNKALVTQASSAIPVVPLYISILYKVMKAKNLHEGCIEQMSRLIFEKLSSEEIITDENNLIRLDDWELREDVQEEVNLIWDRINSDNLQELADVDGYWDDFYKMFGFDLDQVDYEEDIPLV